MLLQNWRFLRDGPGDEMFLTQSLEWWTWAELKSYWEIKIEKQAIKIL